MTDYDLRTREALRRVVLLEYGFGPETLRGRKICPVCGRAGRADRTHCTEMCIRDRSTAGRILKAMVDSGQIKQLGGSRTTRYELSKK